MEPGGRRKLAIRESMSQSDSQNWVHPIFGMKLFLRREYVTRSTAVPGSNGVCGWPPFRPASDPVAQSAACVRPACVAARLAAGCSRLQPFICCGPTIPQVWLGMSSAGLEDRRAGAGGMHSVLGG